MSERLDDTRVRLIEAAGEVFAERGFRAATVREICRRAKANVAAVNYYFGDKQRLYEEVLRYAHRSLVERDLPEWPPGTSAEDKLRGFVELMLADMDYEGSPTWKRRLMMREMTDRTEACLNAMHDFIQPRKEALGAILGELLPPSVSEADQNLIALSIISQCMLHRIHWPVVKLMVGDAMFQSFDQARLTDHITRFSLAALGCGPPVIELAAAERATV